MIQTQQIFNNLEHSQNSTEVSNLNSLGESSSWFIQRLQLKEYKLFLRWSYIETLIAEIFKDLVNLEREQVRLVDNQLEELPLSLFKNNKNLKSLDFSSHILRSIDFNIFKKTSKTWYINILRLVTWIDLWSFK